MRMLFWAAFILAVSLCLPVLASQDEQGDQQQNVFGGTLGDALWTVIAFVVLLAVLGKLAWKPMLKSLEARQEHIQHEIKTAEDVRKQADNLLEDYRQKGLKLIQEATEAAQRSQREITDETHQEALLIRQRAREDIRNAEAAAAERLWNQAGEMMLSLGNAVLGRTVSKEDNDRLVREAIEKIRSSEADGVK